MSSLTHEHRFHSVSFGEGKNSLLVDADFDSVPQYYFRKESCYRARNSIEKKKADFQLTELPVEISIGAHCNWVAIWEGYPILDQGPGYTNGNGKDWIINTLKTC